MNCGAPARHLGAKQIAEAFAERLPYALADCLSHGAIESRRAVTNDSLWMRIVESLNHDKELEW